ncbi:MAG: hypothetical protein WCD18_09600 [Thermosynechococcaceae cyanobacterium]
MYVAMHGEMILHPWRDLAADSDAYSLFVARSSAMGWLTESVENASGGFWGMNDAGQDTGTASMISCEAWFQVSLTKPISAGQPLPMQPFLSCAGHVVARLGTMRLQAAQVLVPLQDLSGPANDSSRIMDGVGMLMGDAGWFVDADPQLKSYIRVTLDGGQNPSIRLAAPDVLQWLRRFKQDVFSCDLSTLPDDDRVVLPGITDELWAGPSQHRITFEGILIEWSMDALGWLSAFLAEGFAHFGVSTPLMLSVARKSMDPR